MWPWAESGRLLFDRAEWLLVGVDDVRVRVTGSVQADRDETYTVWLPKQDPLDVLPEPHEHDTLRFSLRAARRMGLTTDTHSNGLEMITGYTKKGAMLKEGRDYVAATGGAYIVRGRWTGGSFMVLEVKEAASGRLLVQRPID